MKRVRSCIATALVCSCLLPRAQAAAVEPVVAVGRPCTYAVRGDGTLWAWGRKGPHLGVGISSPVPVGTQWRPLQIGAGTDWRTVASAGYHALAIRADGSLWGWGQGASAIGVATLGPDAAYPWYYPSPIRVGTDADWKAVGTGWDGSAGIKTDGSLWAWGSLYKDRAPGEPPVGTPKRLGTDGYWELLAVGPNHALAIKRDGSLWAWGGGSHAQTAGVGGARPEQLGTDADWVAVSTGE